MVRNEYPRPQFERENWFSLNGAWSFDFDDENKGMVEKWYEGDVLTQEINVPFTYQCECSGINVQDFHNIVWYQKRFTLPEVMNGKKIILHFGAVDYKADVCINVNKKVYHSLIK